MDGPATPGTRVDADREKVARRLLTVVEEGSAAIAAGDFRVIRSTDDLERLFLDLSSKAPRTRGQGAA